MSVDWTLLSPLPPSVRAKVMAAAQPRCYARGEVVVHEGEVGDSLHLVRKGRLAVRVSTDSGESATLRVLRPGDAFGELALFHPSGLHRRTATVMSLEEAETLALARPAFSALCATYPQVERLLIALMAERVDQLSQRLLEALYVGVERRVLRRLVELVDIYGEGRAITLIPLTQDDLASLAGATRPTVNQVLQPLATQGLVALHRGSIQVNDVQTLRRRST